MGGWGGFVLHQLGINDKWMDHASQPPDFKRLMQLSKLIRPDQFNVPKRRNVQLFLPANSDQILPERLSLRSTHRAIKHGELIATLINSNKCS